MRSMLVRGGVAAQLAAVLVSLCCVAPARAQQGSGPRETVDQGYTTKKPNSPTGSSFTGVYHAAGDPKGNPPYMRKMVFHPPPGMRYDTTVPVRCTATDVELELKGPGGCPASSRLGGGTTEGIFYEPIAQSFSSPYKGSVDIFNNANEQVMVIQTPLGNTVVRGRIRPDMSVEFASPTCFPTPPAGQQCPVDHVLQLRSSTFMPRYTRTSYGRSRGYATTPPTCPVRRYWRSSVKFWWADGSIDTVVTRQPCRR